jgi:Ca2+-binding RTX toxin-like protein
MTTKTNRTRRGAALVALMALGGATYGGLASASTSHAGWPRIDGRLIINRNDESTPLRGTAGRHNELLGGHGDDAIAAGDAGDVLWGDYKPSDQPDTQTDTIEGGAGRDFIYASHGRNVISSGGGSDQIHAHFGRGSITCTSRGATVFLSHRSQKHYKLHGCPHISFKTVGY